MLDTSVHDRKGNHRLSEKKQVIWDASTRMKSADSSSLVSMGMAVNNNPGKA